MLSSYENIALQKEKSICYYEVIENILLISIAMCSSILYLVVAHFAQTRKIDYAAKIMLPLDVMIPYTDVLIHFYIYMLFFPLTVYLFIIAARENSLTVLRQLVCSITLLQLLGYLIFLFYPTSNAPLLSSTQGRSHFFFSNVTDAFNTGFMPLFNALPCLHVGVSWLCVLFFYKFFPDNMKIKRSLGLMVVLVFILIALSTVTLKYHYIIDLICGFLLAEIAYLLVHSINIFHVEKWQSICGKNHLIFIQALILLLLGISLVLAYPNHMALGH